MFFQNTALLFTWLPLLVAVPLLIHLLNRRLPQKHWFSSVALIRRSMAQRSHLMRWRHWLLTLLRTLLVLLLLLAFIQPMLSRHGQPPAAQSKRRVILVLDHSFSMELPHGFATHRSRAVSEALRLINSLAAEDELHVMAVGRSLLTSSAGWSTNHTAARVFLKQLGPGYERADYTKAIDSAALLARSQEGANSEVWFISDFQRGNWSDAHFAAFPKSTRLFFIPLADPTTERENRAITHVETSAHALLAGGEMTLEITVANHRATTLDEPLEILIGRGTSVELPVRVAPWSVSRTRAMLTCPAPGWHPLVVRFKTPDALPFDDSFHLPLHVVEKEEVLLLTDDASEAQSGLTLRFLEAAINPFADQRGSLLTRRITTNKMQPQDLAGASKLVMTRASLLEDHQARALADHLKAGAGLLYFLDGPNDRENLERLRAWCALPEAVPLNLVTQMTEAEPAQIAKGQFKSRYLRLFDGPARSTLSQLHFYERWRATAVDRAEILLHYADGTPALALGNPGAGALLVANFSVSEIASNLARQRLFPAWIQELVAQLSAEAQPPPRSEPGDLMQAELWASHNAKHTWLSPSGQPLSPTRVDSAERIQFSVTATEPGFYTYAAPNQAPTHLLAANVSPIESDLRLLDPSLLPTQANADEQALAIAAEANTDYGELARGKPVFHWFIIAAIIVLLLETLVQSTVRRKTA